MHWKNPKFTLVELLTVIAIVAILAALLLPALARAKRTAQTVVCMSNEKQLGLGFITYQGDFDETFPIVRRGGGWKPEMKWPALLVTAGTVDSSDVMHCPGFDGHATHINGPEDTGGGSYKNSKGVNTAAKLNYGVHLGKWTAYGKQGPECTCTENVIVPHHHHSGITDGFTPSKHIKNFGEEWFLVDSFSTKNAYSGGDAGLLPEHLSLMRDPYSDFPNGTGKIQGDRGGWVYGPNSGRGRHMTSIRHRYQGNVLFWDGHVATADAEEIWTDSQNGTNPECHWDGR